MVHYIINPISVPKMKVLASWAAIEVQFSSWFVTLCGCTYFVSSFVISAVKI